MTAAARLRELLRGEVREDEPMSRHTTFRLGGPAELFVLPRDAADLIAAVRFARQEGLPWRILGGGSNLLVADAGVRGLTICTRGLREAHWSGEGVTAQAGVSMARLATGAGRRGLAGLAGLAGIPGTLGGAVRMNAGAHGAEIGRSVEWVEVLTPEGSPARWEGRQLGFGYRSSLLRGLAVLSVRLALAPGDPRELQRELEVFRERRRSTQPLNRPSAGSVFKNPPGAAAGRLIEEAGCKGWREGGAQVSKRHANFIVGGPGNTAADVHRLMRRVQEQVWRHRGLQLEPELELWDFEEGQDDR